MPLTQVKYLMIRENLKFSSAARDTWRELSMDAEEKLRDHHLYQEILLICSRTGILCFGCGISVLFFWMWRPSKGLVWEQAELVENSTGCPGFGMAPTFVPCYWSVCHYAHLCCLSLLCWQLLNVGFYVQEIYIEVPNKCFKCLELSAACPWPLFYSVHR